LIVSTNLSLFLWAHIKQYNYIFYKLENITVIFKLFSYKLEMITGLLIEAYGYSQ